MAASSRLHRSKNGSIGVPDSKKAAGSRRPSTSLLEPKRRLFGRLLARRIERARIVDLGDLVVGEAEHLAQDLVGVLAEQR
jgi:hypothetical protein